MIVIDSSVWIDYFGGIVNVQTDKLDNFLSRQMVLVGDLILSEVLQGFRQEREYQIAKKLLESLECRSLVGKSIAIKSAENYRLLRSQGITVRKTIDVMIATFCIEHQLPLLHADKDFDVMKSLGLKTL